MASAVYSEAQPRPLSLCVDSLPSSSPFPSPGSSFLPPPTPGAHEFAMKPPPQSARRDSRKASLVPQTTSSSSSPRNSALPASNSPVTKSQVSDTPAPSEAPPSATPTTNGHAIQSAAPSAHLSSDVDETNVITPTPSSINVKGRLSTDAEPNPGSPEVTSAPTTIQLPSPSEFEASPLAATIVADTPAPAAVEPPQPTSPPASQVQSTQAGGSTSRSRPTSMSSQPPSSYTYFDSPVSPPNPHRVSASSFGLPPTPELTPTRQAPPSPALSRRVSQAPSTMSNISNRSGDLGNPLSRANSRRSARKSKRLSQLQMSSSPGSGKIGGSPLASPSRGHFFSSPDSLSPSNPGGVNASKRLSSLSQAAVQMSPPPVAATTPRTLIKIRDYGFAPGDPRFSGHSVHGVLVPRPNRIKVLTRRLIESFVNPGQKFSVDEEGKVLWGTESDRRRKRREKEEKEEEERLAKEREEKEKGTLRKASIGSSSGSWGRKSKGKKKGGFGARLSWGWSSTGVDGDGYEDDDSDEWSDSDEEGGDEVGQLGRGDGEEGMSSWDILKRLSTWRSSFNQAHGNSHGGGGGGGGRAANGMGDPALGNVPTQIDLERNFAGEEDEEDDEGDYHDAQEYEDGEYEEGEYPEGEEEPLYPGLYRAVYAFEPEGTAEMRLVEDQIVKVVGRGGGVGWAVVVCEDEEVGEGGEKKVKHALVPESYLEPVQFDHDQDAEMGEAVAA